MDSDRMEIQGALNRMFFFEFDWFIFLCVPIQHSYIQYAFIQL